MKNFQIASDLQYVLTDDDRVFLISAKPLSKDEMLEIIKKPVSLTFHNDSYYKGIVEMNFRYEVTEIFTEVKLSKSFHYSTINYEEFCNQKFINKESSDEILFENQFFCISKVYRNCLVVVFKTDKTYREFTDVNQIKNAMERCRELLTEKKLIFYTIIDKVRTNFYFYVHFFDNTNEFFYQVRNSVLLDVYIKNISYENYYKLPISCFVDEKEVIGK